METILFAPDINVTLNKYRKELSGLGDFITTSNFKKKDALYIIDQLVNSLEREKILRDTLTQITNHRDNLQNEVRQLRRILLAVKQEARHLLKNQETVLVQKREELKQEIIQKETALETEVKTLESIVGRIK